MRNMETFDNGNVITWANDLEEGARKQAQNAAKPKNSPPVIFQSGKNWWINLRLCEQR